MITITQTASYFRIGAAIALACILCAGPASAASYTLTLDGSRAYQTIDGFGVNANHRSWTNNELVPVLNALVNQAGITQFRIIFDQMNWEAVNDNSDPNVMNWSYYNTIYSSPDFQALWGMVRYLNQMGLTNGIMLNFQGQGPAWMGGTNLTPGMEDECAETIASLLVYARSNQNLHFNIVGPLNEPDIPQYGIGISTAAQYITVMHDLSALLDTNGLGDIRFVIPDLGNGNPSGYTGTNWLPQLLADPLVMSKLANIGLHSYLPDGGNSVGVARTIQQSAYPGTHFWMTEFNTWCESCVTCVGGTNTWSFSRGLVEYLLGHLANGASAAFVWEGYDSFYYMTDCWSYYGLFAVDNINATPKTYTPRQAFYTFSQVTRYVRPGAQRISLTGTNTLLPALAFCNTNNNQVTIIGINEDTSPAVLSGTLSSLPAITNLELIYTSATTNLCDAGPNRVVAGAFTATIPADSVFTLVGSNVSVSVSLESPPNGFVFTAPSNIALMASASSTAGAITNLGFFNGPVELADASTEAPFPAYAWNWPSPLPGSYLLTARAIDSMGNVGVSAPAAILVLGPPAAVTVAPGNAAVVPYGRRQFTATLTDVAGDTLTPLSPFIWSATGGTITSTGLYAGGGAPGGPFSVTAAADGILGTASVTIETNLNLAPYGTAYSWYGMVNPTDNAPQALAPGLNDGNLTTDVPLVPGGQTDNSFAYEAGGILWTNPQLIDQVVFINGSYTANDNGVFAANFGLQLSTNGSTWTDAGAGWGVSPAYSYNSPNSAGVAYTFKGAPVSVQGVRCVGQVHTVNAGNNSWYVNATEVQAFAASFPPPPALAGRFSGGAISLSWPVSASNFFLESTLDLNPPVVWTPITNMPQQAGPEFDVTLPQQSGQQFFRLHQP
jgi:O-glycosyl hydrolase